MCKTREYKLEGTGVSIRTWSMVTSRVSGRIGHGTVALMV